MQRPSSDGRKKVNRLARHGEEYQLIESFKEVALNKILVGNILDHFELLSLEKLPFWKLLLRVKEQARIKKLEKDVAQGRAGLTTRSQRVKGPGGRPTAPVPSAQLRASRR